MARNECGVCPAVPASGEYSDAWTMNAQCEKDDVPVCMRKAGSLWKVVHLPVPVCVPATRPLLVTRNVMKTSPAGVMDPTSVEHTGGGLVTSGSADVRPQK